MRVLFFSVLILLIQPVFAQLKPKKPARPAKSLYAKKDLTHEDYLKKAEKTKRGAIIMASVAGASLVGGTILYFDAKKNLQSDDIGDNIKYTFSAVGMIVCYGMAAGTGITSIVLHSKSKKYKRKAIQLQPVVFVNELPSPLSTGTPKQVHVSLRIRF